MCVAVLIRHSVEGFERALGAILALAWAFAVMLFRKPLRSEVSISPCFVEGLSNLPEEDAPGFFLADVL